MAKSIKSNAGEQIDLFALSTTAPIILTEVEGKGKKPKVSGMTEVMNAKGEPFKKDSDRFFEVATEVEGDKDYEDRLLEACAAHRGTGAKLAEVVHEGLALGYTEKYIIGIAKEGGYNPQSIRNCFCKERKVRLRAEGGGRKIKNPELVEEIKAHALGLECETYTKADIVAALGVAQRSIKESLNKKG